MFSKKIVLIILLFLIFGCSVNKKESVNVFNSIEYNDIITKAENEALDENYLEANKQYSKALNKFSQIFSFDLYNALVTSIKIKNWDSAEKYSYELIKRGCTADFFERPLFDNFKLTSQWENLENSYEILREVYLINLDNVLIDSLSILQEIDQNQYCLIPSGNIELKNAFTRTIFIDSLLVKLIKNHGYPSEKLIGANIKRDTSISPLPSFFPLLRHSYQANSKLLQNYLTSAVENGHLMQEVRNKISDIDNMKYIVVDCKIYKSRFITSNSYTDKLLEKKIRYNNEKKDLDYVFYAPLAILNNTNIENFSGEDFDSMYEFVTNFNGCN